MAESETGSRAQESSRNSPPIKVVTGTQLTSNLHFSLQPGAIVAHANSRVVFVCG